MAARSFDLRPHLKPLVYFSIFLLLFAAIIPRFTLAIFYLLYGKNCLKGFISDFLTARTRCFNRVFLPASLVLKCDWPDGRLINLPREVIFKRLNMDLLVLSFTILLFYYGYAESLGLSF